MIYFIQSENGGPIKIGTAVDVHVRVRTLSIAHPFALKILAVMEGDVHDERRLHQRYSAIRLNGEWFRDEPELIDFIRENGVKPVTRADLGRTRHKSTSHRFSPEAATMVQELSSMLGVSKNRVVAEAIKELHKEFQSGRVQATGRLFQ